MGACVTTSMSITEELLTLSRTMLTSATAQEWEQVRDIDARRSLLLAGYNAADELHLGRDYVETSLREMLAINQSVLALSLKMRDEITGSLGALQRGVMAFLVFRFFVCVVLFVCAVSLPPSESYGYVMGRRGGSEHGIVGTRIGLRRHAAAALAQR